MVTICTTRCVIEMLPFVPHKILCIALSVQNYLHRNNYLFAVVAFKYYLPYDKRMVHLMNT
jgi:hypothetical protein